MGNKANNRVSQIHDYKQSIWYDNIQRSLLKNGKIKEMIDAKEIWGITSNPTIFEKAIGGSNDYDSSLMMHLQRNPRLDAYKLYEELVIEDIKEAADLLRSVYDESKGVDGFVSIEVSPNLAHDTEKTIEEAKYLFEKINRPNVMVKVPATTEGIPAITEIISHGINVNVTLMFSTQDFFDVSKAYIEGLKKLYLKGQDVSKVTSVASFFISRMDSAVDKILPENSPLRGKVAIAYAKNVYQQFLKTYDEFDFLDLQEKGAKVQRLLWASTGVKNPEYRDCLYMEELMGENTVNTVPPATLDAFRDHGNPGARITQDVKEATEALQNVKDHTINLDSVATELKKEGVAAFKKSFDSLLATLEVKKENILANLVPTIKLDGQESGLSKKKMIEQLKNKNAELWAFDGVDLQEVGERLGWLDSIDESQEHLEELLSFTNSVKTKFAKVVLLGMGGSSLAPEVFMKIFGNAASFPSLEVIDTTNPTAIEKKISSLDLEKTVFIVSSKSGSTIETASLFEFFFAKISKITTTPGQHFIAITDKGSKLEKIGIDRNFLKVFIAPSNVGGRYSVFTYFGMVPAALIGVSIKDILKRAKEMQQQSESSQLLKNQAVALGIQIGECALKNCNKLTLLYSPQIEALGDWVEQLVAESTGKLGKGVLPVVGEKFLHPKDYKNDRIFVITHLKGEDITKYQVEDLQKAGHPVIIIELIDTLAIGAEFFRWQVATAIAGAVLKINPFDQPDVELAKIKARECMEEYAVKQKISVALPSLVEDNIEIYHANIEEEVGKDGILTSLLKSMQSGDYFCIMAYLPDSEEVRAILEQIRLHVQKTCNVATVIGFGPRFLHSTGQLHKGDNNSGVFLQITDTTNKQLPVPQNSYDFNTLISAQAIGDYKALEEKGRRIVRYHIHNSLLRELKSLRNVIESYE